MVWKKLACAAGAMLLCTSVLLAGAQPQHEARTKGKAKTKVVRPVEQLQVRGEAKADKNAVITVTEAEAIQHDIAAAAMEPAAMDSRAVKPLIVTGEQHDFSGMSVEEIAKIKEIAAAGTLRDRLAATPAVLRADSRDACGACDAPYADLGLPGTTVWGESISADCSVDGKWYASFTGIAGDTYYFDTCDNGTASSDLDIKILDGSCAILAGVDGAQSCSWNPDDFTWACPADGTYYVVLAPYGDSGSYNAHVCDGTASDTFTLAYYREVGATGACCNAASGACEEVAEGLCDAPHLTYLGDATTCGVDTCPQPCELTKPAGAIDEPDACGEDTNSGCNADPAELGAIALNDVIFGSVDTFVTTSGLGRDTDWYEITVTETTEFSLTLTSEFPGAVLLVSGGDCAAVSLIEDAYGGDCTPVTITKCVPAGTYWIIVTSASGPTDDEQVFEGYPCGTSNDYILELTGVPCEIPYCEPCFSDLDDDWITAVEFAGMINSTGAEGSPCSYGDYTGVPELKVDIQRGTTYVLNVTFDSGTYTECVRAWIDWNQDNVFNDTDEMYELGSGSSTTVSANITVPLLAPLGETRMRVLEKYSSCTDACNSGNGNYGETEDYTVNILEAPETGACCLGMVCTNGVITQDYCENVLGGVYQGDGTMCDPVNPCFGACCHTDGTCTEALEEDCTSNGGVFSGYGTDCDPNECPQPGAECGNPTQIALGLGDLPHVLTGETNCGMGDNYDDSASTHCLYYYDSGEDKLYELTVTEAMDIEIVLDPGTTTYAGIAIGTTCPPTDDVDCDADYGSAASPKTIGVHLEPGTYYIQVDTWSSPDCIPSYTLTFQEYVLPTGRCCTDPWPGCTDGVTEVDCDGLSGVWTEGLDCTTPCPQEVSEVCSNGTIIDTIPYVASFNNDEMTADGPGASCDPWSVNPTMQNDAWFTYTATEDCVGVATVAATGYNTVLVVWEGADCGSLTEVACANGGTTSGNTETAMFQITAGNTYYFQIGDTGAAEGGGVTTFDFTCSSGTGACCFREGNCEELNILDCMNSNGTYSGDGTSCTPNDCPQPQLGDLCALPLGVEIPGDFVAIGTTGVVAYAETNGYTCGRYNDYDETCMGNYDGGEDAIYELTVTEDTCIKVNIDATETYVGVAISDECPLGETCIAGVGTTSSSLEMDGVVLLPGTYYMQVDTYPAPDCINSYDLTISESDACGVGACCLASSCEVMFEDSCNAAGGTYGGDGTVCGPDCDGNGVTDLCEILAGAADCQGNGVPDSCEIADGTSADLDGNNVPDECDPDCNGNSIPDGLDIIGGTSADCQPDGIPDECQLSGGGSAILEESFEGAVFPPTGWTTESADPEDWILNTNGDYVHTGVQSAAHPWSADDTADSYLLTPELTSAGSVTVWSKGSYGEGWSDLYDIDVVIVVGAAGGTDDIFVGNLNDLWTADDEWTEGTFDIASLVPAGPFKIGFHYYGLDGDLGIIDDVVIGGSSGGDCNANGVPDECDIVDDPTIDCDSNGVIDECEADDCDGNGIPDNCDLLSGESDCNNNTVLDKCEMDDDTDCDGSGILDECELAADPSLDCNGNAVLDWCDINIYCTGETWCDDCNFNDLPDICDLDNAKSRAVVLDESFEGAVFPPAGWTTDSVDPEDWILNTNGDYVHSGLQSTTHPWSASATADSYLLTPELTITSGTVSLWSQGSVGQAWSDSYDIDVVVVVGEAGGADDIFVGNLNDLWAVASEFQQDTFDLTPYLPGGAFRLGFHYYGLDGDLGVIDDIVIDGAAGPPSNDCDNNGIPDDCQICGDLDNDGDVDYDDYQLLRASYGRRDNDPAFNYCLDNDSDGVVGGMDFVAWLTCYRDFVGDPLASVPRRPGSSVGTATISRESVEIRNTGTSLETDQQETSISVGELQGAGSLEASEAPSLR